MTNFVGIEFKTTEGNWARTMIDEDKAEAVIEKLSQFTEVKTFE